MEYYNELWAIAVMQNVHRISLLLLIAFAVVAFVSWLILNDSDVSERGRGAALVTCKVTLIAFLLSVVAFVVTPDGATSELMRERLLTKEAADGR